MKKVIIVEFDDNGTKIYSKHGKISNGEVIAMALTIIDGAYREAKKIGHGQEFARMIALQTLRMFGSGDNSSPEQPEQPEQ